MKNVNFLVLLHLKVRLRDVLIKMLGEMGIDTIGTNISKIIRSDDPIQRMAVYLACKKGNICVSNKKLKYSFDLNGRLIKAVPKAYFGKCDNTILTSEEFLKAVENFEFPYVVIDCSFFDLHSEREKKSLFVQIRETLNVVRKFMWDGRLIVTYKCGVGKYYPSVTDFVKENNLKKIILLDPNAEGIFDGKKVDCYIIGGIVDKSGNKKGLTTKIGEILQREGIKFESKKIVLKGDISGVPDRLNAITEIVLRVVLDGEEIEDAIRKVQSPIFARRRLAKELPKLAIRVSVKSKTFRLVCKDDFKKFDWLNLRKEDFYKVCQQTGHIVVSREVMEEIQKCRWDAIKRRYVLA